MKYYVWVCARWLLPTVHLGNEVNEMSNDALPSDANSRTIKTNSRA